MTQPQGITVATSVGDEDDDTDIDLEAFVQKRKDSNIRSVAYKTVETFAGLTKRKLWLRNGPAKTDGHEIAVPFEDPDMYRRTEHLLGHILFRTDVKAKTIFIEEYTKRVADIAKREGVVLQIKQLSTAVNHMINVLESHRVSSLWGLLYAGSAAFMDIMNRAQCEPLVPTSQDNLLTYFTCLANGVEPEAGELDRFRPYFEEAMRKVERRGFVATLASAKWLVTNVVSEILRQMRNLPPPPPGQPSDDGDDSDDSDEDDENGQGQPSPKGAGASMGMHHKSQVKQKKQRSPQQQQDSGDGEGSGGDDAESPEDQEAQGDQKGQGGDGSSDQKDEDADDKQQGGGGAGGEDDDKQDQQDGGGGEGEDDDRDEWEPPGAPPGTSTKDRSKALEQMVNKFGSMDQGVQDRLEPMKDSKFSKRGANQQSQDQANDALKTDVNQKDKLDDLLNASSDEMQRILEEAQQALRQEFHEDEWLQKDAMAKVVFHDVRRRDVEIFGGDDKETDYRKELERLVQLQDTRGLSTAEEHQLQAIRAVLAAPSEENQTVQRLRALFYKVMGRRRSTLAESGTEVDILARIEGRATGIPIPCFKHEERGQGFEEMILIDLSGSMGGSKIEQARKACRIISKALKFPFVNTTVWGFQSNEAGQVDIVRFEKGMTNFQSSKARATGCTPLHVAVKLAVRALGRGKAAKHLTVVTDGFPVYQRRDSRSYSTNQLLLFTRENILEARQEGITVTGILLGTPTGGWNPASRRVQFDLSPKQMSFVFGPQRNWRMIDPERFGSDLVKVVSTSFIDYLNKR